MNKEKENNNWIWWVIFFLIGIYLFALYLSNQPEVENLEKKVDDLEKKKELEVAKGIREKHIKERSEIQNQLEKMADYWYKMIIRLLIITFLIIDVVVFFIIPNNDVYQFIKINGLIVTILSIIEFFIFFEVNGMHKRITEAIKRMVYDKIYKHRTEDYFEFMANLDRDKISEIDDQLGNM